MGCGPSSQVEHITPAITKEENRPASANQRNGAEAPSPKKECTPPPANTADDADANGYTLTRLLLLGQLATHLSKKWKYSLCFEIGRENFYLAAQHFDRFVFLRSPSFANIHHLRHYSKKIKDHIQCYQCMTGTSGGAAESGKTTLLEQIRLLYRQNYSDSEFMHRKAFIYNNILISIRKLVKRMQETGTPYEYSDNAIQRYADKVMAEEDTQFSCFTADVCDAIQRVWKDPAVQKLYERRSEINLNDSSKYFLENLATINRLDFTPTPRDLIMSYVPTVGVQNVIFSIDNRVFQLFDIGGQRVDRRKWATMYDGIDAIFFCIAISEYNQTLEEDPETNRFNDSLCLLEKINNEPKFANTPLLIFLNEVDVFREKLPLMPLEEYLPEYKGNSADDALNFVEGMARNCLKGRDSSLIRVYRTCAIDTEKMSKILEDAFLTVLNLK